MPSSRNMNDGEEEGDERDHWAEIVQIVRGPIAFIDSELEAGEDREEHLRPLWSRIVFLAFGGIALYGAVAGVLVESWWVWWSTIRLVGAAVTGLLFSWGILTFFNREQGWAWRHALIVNLGFTEILLEFGTLLNLVLSLIGTLTETQAIGVVAGWLGLVAMATVVLSVLQYRKLSLWAAFCGTLIWAVAFWGSGAAFWILWAK